MRWPPSQFTIVLGSGCRLSKRGLALFAALKARN